MNGSPERPQYDGVGIDSRLRSKLSVMADEVAARSTRVAIAVPVRQILEIVHEVFDNTPHVPDYSEEDGQRRWGGIGTYSPTEVPDAMPEVRLTLSDDGDAVFVNYEPGFGDVPLPVELTLLDAEQLFLQGLAAVAEGKRRQAERPAEGLSDAAVDAELARQGIVVTSD